jgi:cbb3-type cytochrome oxidase maturation protein
MTALAWLIPCALFLGLIGLAAFLWSLNSGQFEDLEGAGWRALQDDEPAPAAAATDHPGQLPVIPAGSRLSRTSATSNRDR